MFSFMNSANFVVIVVLGGLGSITGTIISAVAFTLYSGMAESISRFQTCNFRIGINYRNDILAKRTYGIKRIFGCNFYKDLLAGKYSIKKIIERIKSNFKILNDKEINNQGVK